MNELPLKYQYHANNFIENYFKLYIFFLKIQRIHLEVHQTER